MDKENKQIFYKDEGGRVNMNVRFADGERNFSTMKRLLFLLLMAVAGWGLHAQSDGRAKMSPLVRLAAQAQTGKEFFPVRQEGRRGPADGQRLLTAFVQTRTGNSRELLEGYGCRTYAQLDDIAIASIPLERINALAADGGVLRIEAGRSAQTLMDTIPLLSNILPAYQATPQHQAYTGEGVVVGLMDVGFDLTHPNFYSDTMLNGYRIQALWDQLSPDTVGSTLPVGRDFVGLEAVRAQQHSTDGRTENHGTHTLGIAAGSGYDSPYRGVAFGSDICLVSNAVSSDTIYIDPADYYKYTTATDALGFKYLFDYADSQGKPCVASFSEGSTPWVDQEDSLYAAFLEKLTGPGRIICVAAGNENRNMNYAEKPAGTAAAGAFVLSYQKAAQYVIKANGPFRLSLLTYANGSIPSDTLIISSANARLDSLLTDTLFAGNDTCIVNALRYPSCFEDGETIYVLQLLASRNLDQLPKTALVAEGADCRVAIHGSSSSALTNRVNIDPRWNAARKGHNILSPALFSSVICVGGISHRTNYTNLDGQFIDASATQTAGLRMNASSTGPAINGLMKPDVMAPGYNVISSFNSFYEPSGPGDGTLATLVAQSECMGKDYFWHIYSGTSMSCPVVAGIFALWLQACPTLKREDIIGILQRTCRQPVDTLSYPNNEYGYGEIDAYRGLLDILGLTSISDISLHQPAAVSIRPCQEGLLLTFSDVPSTPVSVSLYSTDGKRILQSKVAPASREVTLSLPHLPSGVYAVQVSAREQRFTGSQLVRR